MGAGEAVEPPLQPLHFHSNGDGWDDVGKGDQHCCGGEGGDEHTDQDELVDVHLVSVGHLVIVVVVVDVAAVTVGQVHFGAVVVAVDGVHWQSDWPLGFLKQQTTVSVVHVQVLLTLLLSIVVARLVGVLVMMIIKIKKIRKIF